ncbi:MAG: repeat domain protein [Myxococcaceae bacterium]|nr:repeat domain protein [Myxococcaceae bacterium]
MRFARWGVVALAAEVQACGGSVVTTSAADAGDPLVDAAPVADVVAPTDALPPPDVTRADAPPADADVVRDAPAIGVDTGPTDPSRVVSMSMSVSHECAAFGDGHVRCRGGNYYGQLGIGSRDERVHGSTVVAGLRGVRQIVVNSGYATLTVHDDGTVRSWGSNSFDVLGTTAAPDACPHGPCQFRPTVVAGVADAASLVASTFGACVLRRGRALLCWGSTYINLPSHPTPAIEDERGDIRDLVMADSYVVARRTDGLLLPGLGRQVFGESIPVAWELAPGRGAHLCATLPDRTARCWGPNPYGQVGDGTATERGGRDPAPTDPGLGPVQSIVRGYYHTCAIREDRTLWCWGLNAQEQTGVPLGESETCPGYSTPDRCVRRPRQVAGIDQVESVYLGYARTCAVRTDHSVWCWGGAFRGPSVTSPVPARADW